MDLNLTGTHRVGRETTPDILPASQYLQDKLLERRARNTRPKRARQSDFGPRSGRDDDIFFAEAEESKRAGSRAFDSSPVVAGLRRESVVGGSDARKRAPGAKDLNEQMDRLTKQNFALKLELDHRREHTTKLQEQMEVMQMRVERAEQLEQEHAELLRINSQLVEELERRDKAIEEAIDTICDLEEKVSDLEERHSTTRPSTANADSGYAGTETQEQVPPSSPPEPVRQPRTPHVAHRQPPPAASAAATKLLGAVNGQTPGRPRREPHILSQKKPSTHALRSVYLETTQALHPVQSFNSLLTKRESRLDGEEPTLDSPRLSVLSESSFPSLYSPKGQTSPDKYAWEGDADDMTVSPYGPSAHLRQDSIKRVSQWMEDGVEVDDTPSKSNRISPPISQFADADADLAALSPMKRPVVDTAHYQSLAKSLSKTSAATTESADSVQNGVSYIKPYPIRTDKKKAQLTTFAGPMFGEPLLPPTPDSASTRMLRASRSSIADADRSLLDTTPVAVRGYNALEPNLRTAPRQFRSSVELHSAYESFVQRQNDEAYESIGEDEDAQSDTVRDSGHGYDGYDDCPDGSSLMGGIPSRFLKQAGSPVHLVMARTTNPAMPASKRLVPRRRQSSSEAAPSARKPSMTRAETSPNVVPTYALNGTAERLSSHGRVASPRSQHSGSSNQTIVQTIEHARAVSPDFARNRSNLSHSVTSPTRSRASPSPARTLSHRAHALFRRMSSNQREEPRYSEQREKSPLPTLTSTPSSAYINDFPREARRPGTSQSGDIKRATQITPRPASSKDGSRPSMPGRNNTAPMSPRRPSSASEKERHNFFMRRNSVKGSVDTAPPMPLTPIVQDGSAGGPRGGLQRRRGSIREAVGSAARRPWR